MVLRACSRDDATASRGAIDFGPLGLQGGLGLATFSSFVSLLSILPLAMNQFAIDRAGLTLTLLAPLDDADAVEGEGGRERASSPRFPPPSASSPPRCSLPGRIAGPVGVHSARAVADLPDRGAARGDLLGHLPAGRDLNSIGRGSNAHGAAGLLGMLVASWVLRFHRSLITLFALRILERPILAPVLMGVMVL